MGNVRSCIADLHWNSGNVFSWPVNTVAVQSTIVVDEYVEWQVTG